jgi:(p)ppGpp synthase/HD superfamily hydrolase
MPVETDMSLIFSALRFAAERHREQKRKDDKTPYINHPIEVAETLVSAGGVSDVITIVAAILHDTVEDTATTREELQELFGDDVTKVVLECTDDKSLPKEERKRLQVEHAPHKSPRAKLVKIADKTSNITDITRIPPPSWSLERKVKYLDWAEQVVQGLRGQNKELDAFFDRRLREARDAVALQVDGLC